MKKTLSVGNRSRKPTARAHPDESLNNKLYEALDSLLQAESQEKPDVPAVRLKSTDSTYNPGHERIILIRRNPFPKSSEYERTVTQVNFRSLKQWCLAGIGDLYPRECREEAELNLLDTVHGEIRAKYKDSRNLYFKHIDVVAKFNEEIVHEYSESDLEYKRAQWDVKQSEIELDKVSAVENMDRYQRLHSEMRRGWIITKKGRQMVIQAMLLAMCDALPSSEKIHLPEKIRHNLRTAVAAKEVMDPGQLEGLADIPTTEPGVSDGIKAAIQDCAEKLINLSHSA